MPRKRTTAPTTAAVATRMPMMANADAAWMVAMLDEGSDRILGAPITLVNRGSELLTDLGRGEKTQWEAHKTQDMAGGQG